MSLPFAVLVVVVLSPFGSLWMLSLSHLVVVTPSPFLGRWCPSVSHPFDSDAAFSPPSFDVKALSRSLLETEMISTLGKCVTRIFVDSNDI